jgi:crossover junction endodeoxyribonuclease RuvC
MCSRPVRSRTRRLGSYSPCSDRSYAPPQTATVRAGPYPSSVSVLGIDPGLAACGFGVVQREGSVVRALEHGAWTTRPREPLADRLLLIHEAVTGLIEQHRPEAVAIEDSYVGVDPRAALAVGQARGAVLVACARAGVACTEYSPATVKQAVCGYGRADKLQVQRMVRTILRLESDPQPHHAADALAVAICHALSPPALVGARL